MTHASFDVAIIGAGAGGLTSAVGLAKSGKRVLLIEREHLGGECTNSGCIPSKALLHHAKEYYRATTISGTSTQSESYRQNAFTYVREKINEILAEETPEHFTAIGITVVMGEAVFTGTHTLTVNNTTYTFKKAVIATGSSPRLTLVPGLEAAQLLTNQDVFSLTSIPERILIIGAGPVGMEMGQALAMLGSRVTIATRDTEFATLEDLALRPLITEHFTQIGITIELGVTDQLFQGGVATLKRATGGSVSVPFDKVLIAIGRVPNLPVGLLAAKVTSTEIGIVVDSNYQTTNKSIYALGDVAQRLKFTHTADDTARQVVARIVSRGILGVKTKAVPKVTYTEPEIAQVGLSQAEAEQQYGVETIMRIEVPLVRIDRARTDNSTGGLLVVIAKRLSGKVLGAHMVAPRAGELIAIFTLAIDHSLSLWKLRSTIYAYPSYALLIKKAGDIFLAQQIVSLKVDLILVAKKILPRLAIAALWLTGLYALYTYQQTSGFSVGELSVQLFKIISTTAWGPLLYIIAYTIRPLTLFPGSVLSILAGVFFGFTGGFFYTIIAANLSASFAYAVGRYFAGNSPTAKTTGLLARFASSLRKNPFATSLTLHMTFLPFDLVNYGSGLIKLPFPSFLLGTFIGTLLGIATFVSIGAAISVDELTQNGFSVSAIDGTFLLLSFVVFVLSLGAARLLKK